MTSNPTTAVDHSRRRFLRGGGLALAAPWFASLARASGAAERAPLRSAFIYFPNGVWEKSWVPSTTGRDYELSSSLEPLAGVREHVTVLSGLDKQHSHGGDGHYAKTANFLTGMPVEKTTGKNISSGGISVDQLIAQHVGDQTPLPSLELGTEPVISGIDSNVGYTRLYGSHISWQTARRPLAKEINPRTVYERMFGQSISSNPAQADSFKHLLDHVLADAKDVRRQLGRDDQFKLDEYLDSVRSVEKRIEFSSRQKRSSWRPDAEQMAAAGLDLGVPDHFTDHITTMMDLIVLAFQSDTTRVSTLMLANDVSNRSFSFLDGVQGGHHELSHHENKASKIQQYERINRWHVQQFERMIRKMASIPEGDGSLLDNSMLMFGSSFSDGNRHDPDNLPILVAGRAGGGIVPGRHLAAEGNVPLCNFYLAILRRYGIELSQFGDSSAELDLTS